jgi:hypothetical protein
MKDVQWTFGRPQEIRPNNPLSSVWFLTQIPRPSKLISSFRLGLTALRTARLFRELVGNSYRRTEVRISRLSARNELANLGLTPIKLLARD